MAQRRAKPAPRWIVKRERSRRDRRGACIFPNISIIFQANCRSVSPAVWRSHARSRSSPIFSSSTSPFVSLDAALAARLREELLALVLKRKATTLIVTHDVGEAISIADRIIVLSAAPGRILADRTIEAPRGALTEARAAKMKEEIRSLMANASS